jgi:hypothetical protein
MAQFVRVPVVKSSSLADDCQIWIDVSWINWRTEIRRKDEAGISPEIVHHDSLLLLPPSVLQNQIH